MSLIHQSPDLAKQIKNKAVLRSAGVHLGSSVVEFVVCPWSFGAGARAAGQARILETSLVQYGDLLMRRRQDPWAERAAIGL